MATHQIPFIGAVKDDWQMFSDNPADYVVGLPIGFGASSIVYAATYKPRDGSPSLPCALKVVDLDRLPRQSLRLLRRETQLMSLSKHPNVLRVRGSWMDGHKLYIALRLMNSGSAADVMRYGWPGGMEEEVVKCILKQALEGLNYLHINGFIHRDVKAANLLIDDDGTVLLGDLGVAASLSDEEALLAPSTSKSVANAVAGADRVRPTQALPYQGLGKRKSFVGTPCWMAPELILGKQYDSKADIWSFGITAIELCQGQAPRSREAPSKVLMKTVQDASPTFDRQGGQYKYSKAFKEIVESCLLKDPAQRPTASQLLATPFFKSAKGKSYLVGAVLKDLPPLVKRQERRLRPSAGSAIATYDSWDFSVLASPSISVFPRTHSLTQGQPSSSMPPEDGLSSHALSRFDAAVREGVAAVRRSRPLEHAKQSGEEDNDEASTASSLGASSSSSNPTTPEVGLTPLASTSDTLPSCSPVDMGTVRPGQWKPEGVKGSQGPVKRVNGKAPMHSSTLATTHPSTSEGLQSRSGQSQIQQQQNITHGKPTRPAAAQCNDMNTASTGKKSIWKKFIKGKGGDGGVKTDGSVHGTDTVSKKRQSSFMGRMLERTASRTEPGRRRGSFESPKRTTTDEILLA